MPPGRRWHLQQPPDQSPGGAAVQHQHRKAVLPGEAFGGEIVQDADRPRADLRIGLTTATAHILAAAPRRILRRETDRGLLGGQPRPLPQRDLPQPRVHPDRDTELGRGRPTAQQVRGDDDIRGEPADRGRDQPGLGPAGLVQRRIRVTLEPAGVVPRRAAVSPQQDPHRLPAPGATASTVRERSRSVKAICGQSFQSRSSA